MELNWTLSSIENGLSLIESGDCMYVMGYLIKKSSISRARDTAAVMGRSSIKQPFCICVYYGIIGIVKMFRDVIRKIASMLATLCNINRF